MEKWIITPYEQLRLDNISKNNKFLGGLGFEVKEIEAPVRAIKKRKQQAEPQEATRRSTRFDKEQVEEAEDFRAISHSISSSSTSHYCSNCGLNISIQEGVNLQKAIGGHNSRCRISCQRSSAGKPNYYESPNEDEDHEYENQSGDDRSSTSGIDSGKLPMSMLEYQEELHLKYSADGTIPFRTRNRNRRDQWTIIQQKKILL